ncbi:hypothetical protein [Sedimentitalea todarodis]|uniref:SGNH hydrolase-type esterase domain-containing protein n=1 Tax=Sedimentitalea todarodis TaxID=1631240 RepID=A0ABU3VGL8_9RHOB|nr:hypothetical protein [Sedimentitalea todarodis]MDU9005322.1 hypothetical protein [Sedimentitalea todarodis]
MSLAMIKYAAIGIAVLLIATECVLRWGAGLGDPPLARLDPSTEYELVPSATYRRWGNTIAINANGMRAPEHPALPANQDRHLLLIGDSVIYGGHFLDQSETISARLGELLGDDPRLAGCTLRVLPMAVSSWGLVNQAAFLKKHGPFGASAAGIVVSAHDLYDVPGATSDILPYRTEPSWTAIGDALQAVTERYLRSSHATADSQSPAVRAQLSLAALDQIADTLMDQNVRPILIYHPTTMERSGTIRAAQSRFLEWSEARGIPFLDLGMVQMAENDYRDAIHPTATGAQRIAQTIAPVIGKSLPRCLDF